MNKRKIRFKMNIWVLSFMMVLCGAILFQSTDCYAKTRAEKAYTSFIKKQKKIRNVKKIYARITTTSKDKSQVLLLADGLVAGTKTATRAEAYKYTKGKVVKVCTLTSYSTGLPISSYKGKYLISASNHSICRYLISGKLAYVKCVRDIYLEKDNCNLVTCRVKKDKIYNYKIKSFSKTNGEKFCENIYNSWKPITFKTY